MVVSVLSGGGDDGEDRKLLDGEDVCDGDGEVNVIVSMA